MKQAKHRQILQGPQIEIGDSSYLTGRQNETLYYIAEGCTAYDAGDAMGITERTINAHADNAMGKLNATNRANLVSKAFSLGILRVSIEQRGFASIRALWLMFCLTISTLFFTALPDDATGDLVRGLRTKPSRARSSSYKNVKGGRRETIAEQLEPLDANEMFGAED